MTRLAASSPEMWADLLAQAPPVLPEALESLAGRLEEWARTLRGGRARELAAAMEETRAWKTGGAGVS